jgi:hypothetical protein
MLIRFVINDENSYQKSTQTIKKNGIALIDHSAVM